MSLQIETFPVYPLGCNCSLVYSEETGEAVLIDPGGNEDEIQTKIESRGLKLTNIIHTHAHFDHCLGTAGIAHKNSQARVCLHRGDLFLYENLEMQCRAFGVKSKINPIREISHFLKDEEEINLSESKISIKVLHTPGHTPGSLCFYLELPEQKILFSGDTLFNGSIGRTDLWGGDSEKIIKSIENRLFSLEEETIVIPGHGDFTKIYREKRFNPFF